MPVNSRSGDLAVAVVLVGLAAFCLWGGWHMPAGTFSVPGPGIVPIILSALLAATAFALIIKELFGGARRAGVPVSFGVAPVAIVFASLTGVAVALEYGGFIATLSVFLFVMLRVFSRLGTWRAALLGVVITFAAAWFIASLLAVSLPPGPW